MTHAVENVLNFIEDCISKFEDGDFTPPLVPPC